MKKCNIFVVGGSTGYVSWIENVNLVDSPLKADIVFFTGARTLVHHCTEKNLIEQHLQIRKETLLKWRYLTL